MAFGSFGASAGGGSSLFGGGNTGTSAFGGGGFGASSNTGGGGLFGGGGATANTGSAFGSSAFGSGLGGSTALGGGGGGLGGGLGGGGLGGSTALGGGIGGAFGAANTGSALGGFGATANTGSAFGSSFGAGASATPAFGSGLGGGGAFGASTGAGSLFGASNNANTSLGSFGGGLGAAANTSASGSSLFGASGGTTALGGFGSGLGGGTSALGGGIGGAGAGGARPLGSKHTNYEMHKGDFQANSRNRQKFVSISAMPNFNNKSCEELLFEDMSNQASSARAQQAAAAGGLAGIGGGLGATAATPGSSLFGSSGGGLGASTGGGGLFGASTGSAFGAGLGASTGSAFGSGTSILGNTGGGFGLGAASSSALGAGGGLFGSSTGAAAGAGGLFGNSGATNTLGANPLGGGLGGNTLGASTLGSGLGGTSAFGSGLGGNTASAGGLFGANASSASAGGLFGSSGSTFGSGLGGNSLGGNTLGNSLGGNTLGNTASAFGNNSLTTGLGAPSSGFGAFGANKSTGSAFGALGQTSSGLGLSNNSFGSSTSAFGQPSTGFGAFGQNNANKSIFGQTNTSAFGSTNAATGQLTLLNSAGANNSLNGSLGFGANAQQQQQQLQLQQQQQLQLQLAAANNGGLSNPNRPLVAHALDNPYQINTSLATGSQTQSTKSIHDKLAEAIGLVSKPNAASKLEAIPQGIKDAIKPYTDNLYKNQQKIPMSARMSRRYRGRTPIAPLWPTGLDSLRSPLRGVRPDGTVRQITPGGGELYQAVLREREERAKAEAEKNAGSPVAAGAEEPPKRKYIDEDFVEDDLDTPEGVQRELEKLWATPKKSVGANGRKMPVVPASAPGRESRTRPVSTNGWGGGNHKATPKGNGHARVNPEETKPVDVRSPPDRAYPNLDRTATPRREQQRNGERPSPNGATPKPANNENRAPSPPKQKPKQLGFSTTPLSVPEIDQAIADGDADVLKSVSHFSVSWGNGAIRWHDAVDVSGVDFAKDVVIEGFSVRVYPDEARRPPKGEGINSSCTIIFTGVWPNGKPNTIAKNKKKWAMALKAQMLKTLPYGRIKCYQNGMLKVEVEHF